jgi:hypothetical protein
VLAAGHQAASETPGDGVGERYRRAVVHASIRAIWGTSDDGGQSLACDVAWCEGDRPTLAEPGAEPM